MKKFLCLTAVFFITVSHMTAGQTYIGGDWRSDVSCFARKIIEEKLSPGIGIAVAYKDCVVYTEGFGTADKDTGRPVTEHTRFYIASTTKSLTALAVVLASQSGELDIEKPMTSYLPQAQLPPGIPQDSITVKDLLTLTHGLSGDGPITFRTAYSGQFTRPQLLELLRYHEATGKKGTFDYNNLGYNLLGMILESCYGKSWKDVVSSKVIEPLGMKQTTAYRSHIDPDLIAYPHYFLPEGWRRARLAKEDSNLHAAGGHFASPVDLARYLAAHLSGGILEGRRVFSQESIKETKLKHVDQDRDFGSIHRFGWGYGWDLGTLDGKTLIHRFGSFSGYRSHVSFMPDHDLGVVVLVNGSGPAFYAADLVASYIYDRLLSKENLEQNYTEKVKNFKANAEKLKDQMAEHLKERRSRLKPLPRPLESYAGIYENPKYGQMRWYVLGEELEVKMGVMWSRAEVYNATKNQFRVELRGGGEVISFQFDKESEKATSLQYIGEEFLKKVNFQ